MMSQVELWSELSETQENAIQKCSMGAKTKTDQVVKKENLQTLFSEIFFTVRNFHFSDLIHPVLRSEKIIFETVQIIFLPLSLSHTPPHTHPHIHTAHSLSVSLSYTNAHIFSLSSVSQSQFSFKTFPLFY